MTSQLGEEAVTDLIDLPLRRAPHRPLLRRCWELRQNLTSYDACYVALAETLDVPLLTSDRRVARTWRSPSQQLSRRSSSAAQAPPQPIPHSERLARSGGWPVTATSTGSCR